MSEKKNKKRFDRFGAEIICRFCKSKGFNYNHHPNYCYICFHCGQKGHRSNNCTANENYKPIELRNPFRIPSKVNQGTSMRRIAYRNNTRLLKPGEPVSLDVEKLESYEGHVPGWVVIYQCPKKQRKRNMEKVVYSAKIRQFKSEIKSYATKWSGLTRIDLSEESIPLSKVQNELINIVKWFLATLVPGGRLRADEPPPEQYSYKNLRQSAQLKYCLLLLRVFPNCIEYRLVVFSALSVCAL